MRVVREGEEPKSVTTIQGRLHITLSVAPGDPDSEPSEGKGREITGQGAFANKRATFKNGVSPRIFCHGELGLGVH